MTSPAKAHFLRVAAAVSTAAGGDPTRDQVVGSQYELMLAKLAEDKRQLKKIQSLELKAEVKAKLIPEYMPWIEGVLQGNNGQQDDVLMTVFVWAIDCGQFDLALRIARYAIDNKLVMPDQYQRDVPCVLVEEIADAALKLDEAELPGIVGTLAETLVLTEACDMPDEVRAKLLKAIGYADRAAGRFAEAKTTLERALQLHDKVGVKKDIERLEVLIKNSTGASGDG